MKYQTILFDLDGTLTDSFEGITKSAAHALSHFGIQIDDLHELRCFIGPPIKDSFMDFYGMDEQTAEQAVQKYRERFREKGIYENALYPGTAEMLKSLYDAGFRLCIASSKPKIFVEQILNYFYIAEYFSVVVGSELDGSFGEKTEVIAYALQLAGSSKEETVMIGDRKYDALGAKENEIAFVGACYGFGGEEELSLYPHCFLANSTADITRYFLEDNHE